MRAALPPETLAAVWVSTVAKSGAYEGAVTAAGCRGLPHAAPNLIFRAFSVVRVDFLFHNLVEAADSFGSDPQARSH